ncbi:MAG TPA: hypothetical protein VMM92_07235 [Thermoanaerobaculia bacterium]|nr:hypothetical protein [Thermoanaerobaculia bacterium]
MPKASSATLAELERSLAASLAGRGEGPAGCDPGALARARSGLVAKRRRAAAHLLPRTAAALGEAWEARFAAHALGYLPQGLLYHVDDAWELARRLAGPANPTPLRQAARDDLVTLRLRYARRPRSSVHRIRERRAPLLALVHTPRRSLVVRGLGGGAPVFRFPLGRRVP